MRLIAKVPGLRSEGKEVPVGGEFDAADRDGVILKKLGKASDAPMKEVAPKTTRAEPTLRLQSAALGADDNPPSPVGRTPEGGAPSRRRYQRRDLVAEGSGSKD